MSRCTSVYPGAATLQGKAIRCTASKGHTGDHGHSFAARYWNGRGERPAPGAPRAARAAIMVQVGIGRFENGEPVTDRTEARAAMAIMFSDDAGIYTDPASVEPVDPEIGVYNAILPKSAAKRLLDEGYLIRGSAAIGYHVEAEMP